MRATPLSPVLGALVEGLDLTANIVPDERAELRRRILEWSFTCQKLRATTEQT